MSDAQTNTIARGAKVISEEARAAILAAAGVTKGALYHHFDNKEALGYAVVDEIIATMTHEKWVLPLQSARNPIDTLIDIIQSTSSKRGDLPKLRQWPED